MVRAGMLETLQTEYVQTARLNGLAEGKVLWRYALRNALAPAVQILAQNLQWLIGGIIITESVFAYPGIGSTLVVAVGNRDVTVVQSVAMLIAIVYIVINLVADLIVLLLVPEAPRAGVTGRLRFLRSLVGRRRRGDRAVRARRRAARPVPRAARSVGAGRRERGRAEQLHAARHRLPGRDVLSRLMFGGRSVIGLAAAATVLAYVIGSVDRPDRGLQPVAGRSTPDAVGRRDAGVPAAAVRADPDHGRRNGIGVLIIGVALIQAPSISRVVRTATQAVVVRGYVEAAVARGESSFAVVRREVVPNILGPVLVDLGLRFTYSILIIASVNFLGLGLQPPSSDWALMISENRQYISLNPWAVLAPAAMIALLTIGINLMGDAIARSLGRSYVPRTARVVTE